MDYAAARFWVFYDAACGVCSGMVRRFSGIFARRGIGTAPLQDPDVARRLGLMPGEALEEMKVLAAGGEVYGGVDGVLYICRAIWWLWPLGWMGRMPGFHGLLGWVYRQVAARRRCAGGSCAVRRAGNGGVP